MHFILNRKLDAELGLHRVSYGIILGLSLTLAKWIGRASALTTASHFECQPTSDKDWKVTTCVGIKK